MTRHEDVRRVESLKKLAENLADLQMQLGFLRDTYRQQLKEFDVVIDSFDDAHEELLSARRSLANAIDDMSEYV